MTNRTGQPRTPRRPRPQPESIVVAECLDWLVGRHVFCWRNNTGALPGAGGRPIRFGRPGSGDIIGMLPDGRFFSVECKAAKGRVSEAQKRFINRTESCRGLALLCQGPHHIATLEQVVGPILAETPAVHIEDQVKDGAG